MFTKKGELGKCDILINVVVHLFHQGNIESMSFGML